MPAGALRRPPLSDTTASGRKRRPKTASLEAGSLRRRPLENAFWVGDRVPTTIYVTAADRGAGALAQQKKHAEREYLLQYSPFLVLRRRFLLPSGLSLHRSVAQAPVPRSNRLGGLQ